MSFAEKLLRCVDCKKGFTFSVEDQKYYSSRGFVNEPGRCPPCRQTKKNERPKSDNSGEDYGSSRQLFHVTCTQCGKATRVPFQPRENGSVYCSECYVKSKAGR